MVIARTLLIYDVHSYPTFNFSPKNNKTGEDYVGGRDLDNFVVLINARCGTNCDEHGL